MKKNVMMRIASILVVAVLLTTCVISGTFAKYVTKGEAEDRARVAKFGVLIDISGDSSFANTYAKTDADYSGTLSVEATDKVVAPGTASASALTFSLTGTPEVATRIQITLSDVKDVFLKAGDYKDMTQAPYKGTFNVANDYYPVKWTLKQTAPVEKTIVDGKSLADINTALTEFASGKDYAPGVDLSSKFELSWEWAFSVDDKADTLLGDLAADSSLLGKLKTAAQGDTEAVFEALTADTDYNLTVAYKVEISVTQID